MFIWLLTQDTCTGYDTYDSCVVLAPTEEEAKLIHPAGDGWENKQGYFADIWPHPDDVTATLIGYTSEASDKKVICASYNAG